MRQTKSGRSALNTRTFRHAIRRRIDAKLPSLVECPVNDFCGNRRSAYLDVFRAVAILLILFGHIPVRMPDETFGAPVFFILRQSALLGVDLFLVLSGFFIAGYLFEEHRQTGSISFARFFSRRALKIYPSYGVAVLLMFVWQAARVHRGTPALRITAAFGDIWVYLAHLQNYRIPRVDAFVQTWTLVLLIQFYIAFAVLLYTLDKFHRDKSTHPFRAIPWIFAISVPVCFFLRRRVADHYPIFNPWTHNFALQLRVDEILSGVWIAYLVVYARPRVDRIARYWPLLLLVCIGTILPVSLRKVEAPRFLHLWGYTLAAFGCAGLVLVAWTKEKKRLDDACFVTDHLLTRLVASLGVISYSIYIWHLPFGAWMGMKVGNRLCTWFNLWGSPFLYWLRVSVYFGVAIGASSVMYVCIERPGLLFGKRFRPAR